MLIIDDRLSSSGCISGSVEADDEEVLSSADHSILVSSCNVHCGRK